jgi:hypothetical protein
VLRPLCQRFIRIYVKKYSSIVKDRFRPDPVPRIVEDWAQKTLKDLNIPNAHSIRFVKTNQHVPGWSAAAVPKMIFVKDSESLAQSLQSVSTAPQFLDGNAKNWDVRRVAESNHILKHEIGHIVNKDHRNGVVSTVVPTLLADLYIKNPAAKRIRFLRTIGVYVALPFTNLVLYWRYRESKADEFALQNAHSRVELEMAYSRRKSSEEWSDWQFGAVAPSNRVKRLRHALWFDLMHPHPMDRKDMTERYLNEWKKNHPNQSAT